MTRRGQAPSGRPIPVTELIDMLAGAVEATDAVAGVEAAAPIVAELVRAHVAADAVGIIRRQGPLRSQRLAATDPELLDLDSAGPGAAAAPWSHGVPEGTTLVVDDVGADPRWPSWAVAASAQGWLSAAFIAMPQLRGGPVVLELYARRPEAFTADDMEAALTTARLAGLALRVADRVANLEDAMHTRGLIGQAQGILMQQYDLTGEQALAYLRRRSQASHRKIAELATEVVRQREAQAGSDAGPD